MNIVKLDPVLKDYIWGGKRLCGYSPEMQRVAESWVLSCHDAGESRTEKGEKLGELFHKDKTKIFGANIECEKFPILIKLIDAADNLSVQVHPDDNYAKVHENQLGKTEMWIVLDCEPNAELLIGFREDITKEAFLEHLQNGTILDVVNRVPVHPGDAFLITAGTLHAIGRGILIAEIQQSSDVTYRVFDYDRRDKDGNTRPLHVKQASEVLNFSAVDPDTLRCNTPRISHTGYKTERYDTGGHFGVKRLWVSTVAQMYADEDSFHSILITKGNCVINSVEYHCGESVFVPAGYGTYLIKGNCQVIITSIPAKK